MLSQITLKYQCQHSTLLHFTGLNLSWNVIRLDGAEAISKGLAVNTGLKRFDLSWNSLGESGGSALGIALKSQQVTGTSGRWVTTV